MKKYIRAMAEYKRDIIDKLDSAAEPVIEHIIKLYCWQNALAHDKWIGELRGLMPKIHITKETHKYPKEKDVFYGLWEMSQSKRFHKTYLAVIEEYSEEYGEPEKDEEETRTEVIKYLKWLARMLAEDGVVIEAEVRKYVKENLVR